MSDHLRWPGSSSSNIPQLSMLRRATNSEIIPWGVLLKMQNSNIASTAVSKHISSLSPYLADLNYLNNPNHIFWNISGPK